MYAAIRMVASLVALAIGWTAAAGVAAAVTWYAWSALAEMVLLADHIAPVPLPARMLWPVLAVPFLLLSLSTVSFVFMSPRWIMDTFDGSRERDRLVNTHPLVLDTAELCEELGISRPPAIFVYGTEHPNAFAFTTLSGSLIAVSLGLTRVLGPSELRWVLAHQLVRIRHLDTFAGAFWVNVEGLVDLAWRAHRLVTNAMVRGVRGMRMHCWTFAVPLLPILLLSYLVVAADFLSRRVFIVCDCLVGHAMDLRADAVASRVVGADIGIRVLDKLPNGIEPDLMLFARSAVTSARLERLHRLVTQPGHAAPD